MEEPRGEREIHCGFNKWKVFDFVGKLHPPFHMWQTILFSPLSSDGELPELDFQSLVHMNDDPTRRIRSERRVRCMCLEEPPWCIFTAARAEFTYQNEGYEGVRQALLRRHCSNKERNTYGWVSVSKTLPEIYWKFPDSPRIEAISEVIFTVTISIDPPTASTCGYPSPVLVPVGSHPKIQDTILNECRDFLSSEEFSDFEIHVESGRVIRCHRIILAARCPVFYQMFQHGSREVLEGRIEIQGVRAEVMAVFVQYLYRGDCDYLNGEGQVDDLIDLYVVADRYLMDELKVLCEKIVRSLISEETALRIWGMASFYDLTELMADLREFCSQKRQFVINASKDHPLRILAKKCFPELLCHPSKNCTFCQQDQLEFGNGRE